MPSSIATPPQPAARPNPGPLALTVPVALAAIALITVLRVVLALLDRTELSTDEAQYWLWGQSLEFGYYSKPPLIGWILRAATDVLGDSIWAVRVPAPLIHAATAMIILLAGRRLLPGPAAALAALCYLTMPAVTLGSALMTTDTPLLLAAAVALWAQLRLGEARAAGQGAPGLAAVLGLALGLGLLAKHAMLFWLAGALIAAALSPAWRPRLREALTAVLVFLAVIAPHLAWLGQTGFVTVAHVQDITRGDGLSLTRPLRFLAEQALVMGPILIVALALGLWHGRHGARAGLAVLALTPLVVVLGQGVQGPVLANWAVLYLVPGSLIAAAWLAPRPRLTALSLALGLAVTLILPVGKVLGTGWRLPNGDLVFARYLGHADTATWALDLARSEGAGTLVARDRDLLADLSWFGAASGIAVRAVPPQGAPGHHWELSAAFDPATDPGPVLLLLRADRDAPCPGAETLARRTAGPGFLEGQETVIFRLQDPACLIKPGP